jgi:hypothetical protein
MLIASYRGSIAGAAGVEAPPASEQANCFVESGADTVVVSSMSALAAAVNAAPPGRNILVAPGTYSGGTRTFNRIGAEGHPIVVRPQNGLGTVTINGARWTIEEASSWLVFEKFHFGNARITLAGDHNRISRCQFRDVQVSAILVGDSTGRGARDCRIDHCDFSEFTNPTVQHSFINLRGNEFADGNNARILIDYCYFHDVNVSGVPNAVEPIGTFANAQVVDLPHGETVILDHCLFSNIMMFGDEDELITMKQGGWIVRFCTFLNTNLDVSFRTTANSELRSCWFEEGETIRVYGDDNLIIGNRVIGPGNIRISCGNATTDQMAAGTVSIASYARCANNRVIGNRVDTGTILVGGYNNSAGNPPPSFSALNNTLEANTCDSGGAAHTLVDTIFGFSPAEVSTTVNETTAEPFTPAIKLTAADVGLIAPDPLCG